MFREVRRRDRQLSKEEVERILFESDYGTLSLIGDMGYPYGVPISYIYIKDKIYFHFVDEGHKYDAILKEPKASFSIVSKSKVMPNDFTNDYESVIAFGKIKIVDSEEEIIKIAMRFGEKLTSRSEQEIEDYINSKKEILSGAVMEIEHISGKARKFGG